MKEAKVTPKFKVGDVLERKDKDPLYRYIDRVSWIRGVVTWDGKGEMNVEVSYWFPTQKAHYPESELTLVKEGE